VRGSGRLPLYRYDVDRPDVEVCRDIDDDTGDLIAAAVAACVVDRQPHGNLIADLHRPR
jgi:hypothetical protein